MIVLALPRAAFSQSWLGISTGCSSVAIVATYRVTYDLRRLRLRGLIERVAQTHRYQATPLGAQVARFYVRALRPAPSVPPTDPDRARPALQCLDTKLAKFLQAIHLVA